MVSSKIFGTGTIFTVAAGQVYVRRGGPFTRPSLAALKQPYEVQNMLQKAIAQARHLKYQHEIQRALFLSVTRGCDVKWERGTLDLSKIMKK